MKKRRYYHVSPRRFRRGQVLTANNAVHMTESPLPHYTIFEEAYKDGWYVYEVVPLGTVTLDKCWDAWLARAATVKRLVGSARGIIGHSRWNAFQEKTTSREWNGCIPGSKALWSWAKSGAR